ncbi:MAG: glycosyltransferase [Rhodobacteraceae bacterium]|nr:glycosyltransferase [Paracoccaceae bacterium]
MSKYMQELDWQKDEPEKLYDTPIILRGFYNKADGIGSHLPNMYDQIFSNYKNVSFILPSNRNQNHFPRLKNRVVKDKAIHIKEDLKWYKKWGHYKDTHIKHPDHFNKAKLIDVGGFDNVFPTNMAKERAQLKAQIALDHFKMKKLFNVETYLYLMWENSGIEIFEDFFELYDCIVVTNKWLEELIIKRFPHINVKFIGHVASYYKQNASGVSDNFIFGFSGGLWERKKADVVVNAFNLVKEKGDILKVHSRDSVNTPHMIRRIKKEIEKSPSQIEFKNETLNDKDFAEWWDTLNCYVFISGGESYSVTPRQALMQGTPVILSKNTSHLDLLDVPGILWVNCEEQATARFSGHADTGPIIGNQFEPILDEAVECMKEVKSNYTYWKAEAIKGGEIIKKRTSPENIAKQWRNVLCK